MQNHEILIKFTNLLEGFTDHRVSDDGVVELKVSETESSEFHVFTLSVIYPGTQVTCAIRIAVDKNKEASEEHWDSLIGSAVEEFQKLLLR